MKREIREFFDVHGLETHKLVERNRKGLDRPLIEIGMKRMVSLSKKSTWLGKFGKKPK
jgi:hypothetical protein